jgi:hypothetical protein
MKKSKSNKNNGNGSATHNIRLEFTHPQAKTVCLAGTFNDWRPTSTPMIALAWKALRPLQEPCSTIAVAALCPEGTASLGGAISRVVRS